jgi:hypothetical protein
MLATIQSRTLSSCLLFKNINIRIYKTIVFAYGSIWVQNLVSHIKGGNLDRVLRRLFGLRRYKVMGDLRTLHKELHNFYSSLSIIRMIKSKRIRWEEHVAQMGEKRTAYGINGKTRRKEATR